MGEMCSDCGSAPSVGRFDLVAYDKRRSPDDLAKAGVDLTGIQRPLCATHAEARGFAPATQ